MKVVKIGSHHIKNNTNCQDAAGSVGNRFKIVCDGCSEGLHSEVGAKLFCKMVCQRYGYFISKGKTNIDVKGIMYSVMDELVRMIGDNPQDLKDYLSFTIIATEKFKDTNDYILYHCGDGYVVYFWEEYQSVNYRKIDCGEYPKYLVYNYVSGEYMKHYSDGVRIETVEIEDAPTVGVASDGIRFVADLPDDDPIKKEFNKIIFTQKDLRMRLFVNRHPEIFKDDFSIVL